MPVELFTKAQREQLLQNGRINAAHRLTDGNTVDHPPVVKLFTPWSNSTWLLSELEPEQPNIAFGLCDLGFGFPELGSVDIDEIKAVHGPFGLNIERDLYFQATHPLSVYANDAHDAGHITA